MFYQNLDYLTNFSSLPSINITVYFLYRWTRFGAEYLIGLFFNLDLQNRLTRGARSEHTTNRTTEKLA